jgi:hypothetical protein
MRRRASETMLRHSLDLLLDGLDATCDLVKLSELGVLVENVLGGQPLQTAVPAETTR